MDDGNEFREAMHLIELRPFARPSELSQNLSTNDGCHPGAASRLAETIASPISRNTTGRERNRNLVSGERKENDEKFGNR
jgi:hypothetical protein